MANQSTAARSSSFALDARPARPIDLVHLAKQCLGDEHLEYEILRLFDSTLVTYLGRLAAAQNREAMLLHLHSIKGAANGVGAFAVADLARAIEAKVQAGGDLLAEQLDDLAIAAEEVRVFIADMLSRTPA